jgi:hypothetical protein
VSVQVLLTTHGLEAQWADLTRIVERSTGQRNDCFALLCRYCVGMLGFQVAVVLGRGQELAVGMPEATPDAAMDIPFML